MGQLRIEYADGAVETVGTDEQWRVTPGPVTFANVYGGEDYDARRESRGWDSPGFDDRGWGHAAVFDGPKGRLCGHSRAAPPLATFEVLAPVSMHRLRPGVAVYDLGQNASLMLHLKVRGPAGAAVKIIPAELLAADGSVDWGSVGGEAWWRYTLAGTGATEEWRPREFLPWRALPPGGESGARGRRRASGDRIDRGAGRSLDVSARSAGSSVRANCSTASTCSCAGRSSATWSAC